MSLPKTYYYRFYGLRVKSRFPFPTNGCAPFKSPDLTIDEGHTAAFLRDEDVLYRGPLFDGFMYFHSGQSGTLLTIKDICHIWIGVSGEIVMERMPNVSLERGRFFVLGTALGVFLLQRGAFPLHGSTVSHEGRSIMFIGPSGVGKSTLSAFWLAKGYNLVADDVSLVQFTSQGIPVVFPGLAQVKLWSDSLYALNHDPNHLPYILEGLEKRRLNVPQQSQSYDYELKAIIEVTPDDCEIPMITLLNGADRFSSIACNIYRGETIPWLRQLTNHFIFTTRLANAVPVFRLIRPYNTFALDKIFDLVDHTIAKMPVHESATSG